MATNIAYFLLFLIVAGPLIWWLMWREDFDGMQSEWRFKQDLKQRHHFSQSEFFDEFCQGSAIERQVIIRLLLLFADQFDIDPTLIRPTDNFFRIYGDLDAVEFFEALRREFGVSFSNRELEDIEGSFDSIVRAVNSRLKPKP
jgi:hypothetical protein